jgi:hypothetical protein
MAKGTTQFGKAVTNVLMAPLWVAAIFTGSKSFVDNPIIGNAWLNKLGLHQARMHLAARLAKFRRWRLGQKVDRGDCEAFERDGFVIKENFLPPEVFEQLRSEVLEQEWDAHEMRQGVTVTRRVLLDGTTLRTSRPRLAGFIAGKYLTSLLRFVGGTGGQPVMSIQSILANQGVGAGDPQCAIHSDTFHSTSKAWFFLHDVGANDGPFSYVPGSHKVTSARLQWEREQSISARGSGVKDHAEGSFRISVEDLAALGLPPPKSVPVKANTLVVADTFGFHARTPSPGATCRIEIYATLRRNPFLPWTGLDPLALPFVKNRMGATLRLLDRLGIARMAWRPVGRLRLSAPPRI